MVLVVIMYMILALSFVVSKFCLMYSKPFFLITVRMIAAGSCLLGYLWYTNQIPKFSKLKADWYDFLTAMFFHIFLVFTLEFWSMQYVTALKAVLIYSATPFVTALFAYLLLKERLSQWNIAGMLLGVCGLVPLLTAQILAETASTPLASPIPFGPIFGFSLPEILLTGSMLSATYAWFIIRRLMHKGYSFIFINGITMFVGGLLCGLTALGFEGINSNSVSAVLPFLFWLSLLVLMSNVIFYNLYGFLIKKYGPTFVSLSGFLCPVFSTFFEWLLMNGTITWHHFFALFCITTGLFIFYKE